MSQPPDTNTTRADTYKEIYVTGQVSNLNYDGLKLDVLHDSYDLANALTADRFNASKIVINRRIECTLNMPPQTLKTWAIILANDLKRYESTYGRILSPEEIMQKQREHDRDAAKRS